MKNQIFGNWQVSDAGINWIGTPRIDYLIPARRLAEAGPGDRKNMYDFLVHLPEKTWVTEEDMYTLNTAFVYAMEAFGHDFGSASFIETLIEQQSVFRNS